jgi:hypothetical protein
MKGRGFVLAVVTLTTLAAFMPRCHPESPSPVEVVGCLLGSAEHLLLQDEDGTAHLLEGHGALLKAHIGDELKLRGMLKETDSGDILHVLSFSTIVNRNAGVQPRLGDPRSWKDYRNDKFGFEVRIPRSFSSQNEEPAATATEANFAGESPARMLKTWSFPSSVYPHSNFEFGSFSVYVAEDIRSEGTCLQFGLAEPELTISPTFANLRYRLTQSAGAAGPQLDEHYDLHTFQNGFCYQLSVGFGEYSGMGSALLCAMRWPNRQKLIDLVLEHVSFFLPQERRPSAVEANAPPKMTSFKGTPTGGGPGFLINLNWSSTDADYVQLQYPCTDLFVRLGEEITCGAPSHRDLPPNGSTELLITNLTGRAVSLEITAVPFSRGKPNSDGAKKILLDVPPERTSTNKPLLTLP